MQYLSYQPNKQKGRLQGVHYIHTTVAHQRDKTKEDKREDREETGPSCLSMFGFQCKTEQLSVSCQTKASPDSRKNAWMDPEQQHHSLITPKSVKQLYSTGCISILIQV